MKKITVALLAWSLGSASSYGMNVGEAIQIIKKGEKTRLDIRGVHIGPEGVEEFGAALAENTSLTSLNITNTGIGPEGAKKLITALARNKTLTHLNLCCNNIGDSVKTLIEPLSNTFITSLELGYNNISSHGIYEFIKALKTTCITNLEITNNYNYPNFGDGLDYKDFTGDKVAKAVAKALLENTTLTILDLSESWFGNKGAQALAEALKQNTSLTSLILHGNRIGPKGANDLIKNSTTLRILDLTYNRKIGCKGVKGLENVLANNTTLTSLNLSDCDFKHEGAKELGKALANNTTLTRLDLSRNSGIGLKGAKDFAEAFSKNTTLTDLNLSLCLFGEEGCGEFGKALANNKSLTNLHIGSNHMGDKGFKEFVEAFVKNTTLTSLDLGSLDINDIGAEVLGKALVSNTSLTALYLKWNKITPEGFKAMLHNLFPHNHVLQVIDLYFESPDEKTTKFLESILQRNKHQLTILKNFLGFEYFDLKFKWDERKNENMSIEEWSKELSAAVKHPRPSIDWIIKEFLSNKEGLSDEAEDGIKKLIVELKNDENYKDEKHSEVLQILEKAINKLKK